MDLIRTLIPYFVLVSQLLLVFAFLAVIYRKSWGNKIFHFIGKQAILLGFLVVFGSIVGSLFYSNVAGYEACVLCWWQRIFLYPEAVILAIAWWKKDRRVYRYIVPLASIAFIIGFYQAYSSATGFSVLPCTAEGSACTKVYVNAFGYLTIPVMSVTVALWMIFLSLTQRTHKKHEDSNT